MHQRNGRAMSEKRPRRVGETVAPCRRNGRALSRNGMPTSGDADYMSGDSVRLLDTLQLCRPNRPVMLALLRLLRCPSHH